MKLRSHWQLLCKFKRQFTHQVHVQLEAHDGRSCVRAVQGIIWRSRGQVELHRRVYRAQRRAQEDRESCTDGCTGHEERRPLEGHLESTWIPLGSQLESTWSPLGGHLEAIWRPLGAQVGPTDAQEPPRAVKLSSRAPKSTQVEPKRRPRDSKLSPRRAQEAPS